MIDEITKLINQENPNNQKGFDFFQISKKLEGLSEDIKDTFECKSEHIAFSLMPQHSVSLWGTYYGSFIKKKKEDGTPFEYPSKEQITENVINDWRNRVDECENPYLQFRYCDFVYDLGTTLLNQKFDYRLLDKLLSLATTVADEDYPSAPYITRDILERAFRISKTQEQRDQIKQAFYKFERKYANKDSHPKYWRTLFSLMLEFKKNFSEQEISALVKAHEARFKRLCSPDTDGFVNDSVCKDQAVLLCKYYACWFHYRHYLVDAYIVDNRIKNLITLTNALFYIERESSLRKHTSEQRFRFRLKYGQPIVKRIIKESERIKQSGSEYGELVHRAIDYFLNDQKAFMKYLQDGRIEMHNNAIERMFRHIAIGRRNWLHTGSHLGAENIAFMYSLLESCKLNNIDFGEYVENVLTRLMQGENVDVTFLPNNYKTTSHISETSVA